MKRIAAIAFLLSILNLEMNGQSAGGNVSKTGTTAAAFLEIGVGAAAMGMGGAYVSVVDNASALYWNAARIASQPQLNVALVHTNWIAETKFDFAGLVVPLGELGTVGFSITSLSMPDMKVRSVEMPEGTGEYFSAGNFAGSISYARHLTERFSIGLTAKYIQENIWHESASAFALDVGTSFKTDLAGGLTIGATLSNFGTSMRLFGRDARTFIRLDKSKLGSNERIPATIEFDSWDLPLLFQIGVSTHIVDNPTYRWILAFDALHPSDNYESMNVGTQIVFFNMVSARAGYRSLFLHDSEGGMSFGVGVMATEIVGSMSVGFDYGFQDMGRLENVHIFSLDLRF